MKLGTYIMASKPISTAYFINPSHQSVCLCVSFLSFLGKGYENCTPVLIAKQRLRKRIPAAIIHATVEELLDAWVCGRCLCIRLSLLGNSSVKLYPCQRRNVGGFVSCMVRVGSKEIRRLILPRTSCISIRLYSTPPKTRIRFLHVTLLTKYVL
jgi:hypothetical protein